MTTPHDGRKNYATITRAWLARLSALVAAVRFGAVIRLVSRVVGRTTFTLAGFLLLGVAALLISIIQFQIRIIEAKNQSRNFSLTSLTQSVVMQQEFVDSVKTVQDSENVVTKFIDLLNNYYSESARSVSLICGSLPNKDDQLPCVNGITGALRTENTSEAKFLQTVANFIKVDVQKIPAFIKPLATEAYALAKERNDYQKTYETEISKAKSACTLINIYVISAGENSFIQSFSPQYVTTAVYRCSFNWSLGGAGNVSDAQQAPQTQQSTLPTKGNLQSELAGALFFDLVAYFKFYQNMFDGFCQFTAVIWPATTCSEKFGRGVTEQIVIAPIDISFVMLVIACGALGAMLRIAAERYNPKLFGKDYSEIKATSWMYYFITGTMCALIVYILAKTVFSGLTDTTYAAKSGNMSPFVIAFMAVVSGLLCEEAFQQIIRAGKATLARSTGDHSKKN